MEMSNSLQAALLANDPRINNAKKLILDAIKERQLSITGVQPGNPTLKENYHEALSRLADIRGFPLWFPYLGSGIGNGPLVELMDGSIKYDFISGIGVHFFGHSHPVIIEASLDAAVSDTILQGNLQQNAETIELLEILTKAARLPHCFLTTSGSMAGENALKIAFQKRFPAHRLFAFERCFAGRTLALSQINDKPAFREGLPPTIQIDYIPFFDYLKPEESIHKALNAMKKQISRYPKDHAAMMFELVQGEGGFFPGSRDFFKALMQLCKENHIAVIVDEIQTFGRTLEPFSFHYYELEEFVDICTIGKLSCVCATLFTDEYKPRPGLLSQTFTSSSSAIRCSTAILKILLQEEFYGKEGKFNRLHNLFEQTFDEIGKKFPGAISGPFGIGGMIAFTPFDGSVEIAQKIVHSLFDEGLITFIAGSNPTRIRMLPPLPVMDENDIQVAKSILNKVIERFI